VTRRMIMIGGWTSIFEKAKACGFDLTVVQRKQGIKPKDIEVVDQIISSPLNDKNVIDIVAAIHQKNPFDVVVSFQELGVLNAALIKEKLGIVGNPLQAVMLTRDKGMMREHLREKGIASIPFAIVSDVAQTIEFGRKYGWPIVIKPANGVGSLHIHKLSSEAAVADVFDSIAQDPTTVRLIKNDFPSLNIIAEKFIPGPEVSVEAVTWNGRHTVLMVTDKIHSGPPNFVETGHSMPSALPDATLAAIRHLTETFLDSIGHMAGPSHTEIIISDEGPIIVESHTRTGGDYLFEMVELACGIDMFDVTLKGFAGAFPDLTPSSGGSAAIRYWALPQGQVRSITGMEQARACPGIVRCELDIKAGDTIKPLRYSDDRPGYILSTGTQESDAITNVNRALREVTVELETAPG
jgi:biotin carboxylase